MVWIPRNRHPAYPHEEPRTKMPHVTPTITRHLFTIHMFVKTDLVLEAEDDGLDVSAHDRVHHFLADILEGRRRENARIVESDV